MSKLKECWMSDRVAVLLARAECRDNSVAVQVCDSFLKMFDKPHQVTFADKSVVEDKS